MIINLLPLNAWVSKYHPKKLSYPSNYKFSVNDSSVVIATPNTGNVGGKSDEVVIGPLLEELGWISVPDLHYKGSVEIQLHNGTYVGDVKEVEAVKEMLELLEANLRLTIVEINRRLAG